MSDQTVTELSIDADTSGADQFSQAMAGAGTSAVQATLAVAGAGAAFAGLMTGLRAFVDYVGTTNQQFADIGDNAAKASMSTAEFQQTLFAAKASGLSDKDFVSGLDKIGADLQAAGQGVTQFSKLFDANGVSIKNTNGQLIDTRTALNDIAGLMNNATPQVQAAIARIVGLSQDWVPFLKGGVDGLNEQKDAASALGVVIDGDVIQRAQQFSDAWKTAVATWDLQFKASLANILPLLTQLADMASSVINTVGQVSSFFHTSLTPTDQLSSSDLLKQADAVSAIYDKMVSLNGAMNEFQAFKLQNAKESLGLPGDADLATVSAYIDKLHQMAEAKAAVSLPTVTVTGGGTSLPSQDEANDAVDRAINILQKHTNQTIADAQAVGLGTGALELFRAKAAETSAIQANGGEITDAQKAKFDALTVSAGAAADALAKAKVASDVQFASGTALLGASDVQIANQLKTIYGNDIPAALNSTTAAQIRFNDATKEVSNAIQNDLVSGLTDITMGTVSASQGFANLGQAVLKSIDQMIVKFLIVQPMANALQASLGGGSSILSFLGINGFSGAVNANGSIAGAIGPTSVGGAPLVLSAKGNIFNDNIVPFANGGAFTNGVVDSPTLFKFANGGSFGVMGEAGPEAVVPLKRGADGSLGVASAAQAPNVFTYAPVIDARGADAAAVARLAQVVANDRQNFERNVTAVVQKTAANKPGAFR